MTTKWGVRLFRFTLYGAAQFVVLTAVAMLIYPGGTIRDPAAGRYRFFYNFFSDLGRLAAPDGTPNAPAAILFVIALSVAGLSLAGFFLAAPRLFRRSRAGRALAVLGSICGVVSGLAFIGIAWTPADVWLAPHHFFVATAFEAYLAASLLYAAAIGLDRGYPNRYAAVYLLFAGLLAGYLGLLFGGPRPDTLERLAIQATGQKIIVYALIVCTWLQGRGALRLAAESDAGEKST